MVTNKHLKLIEQKWVWGYKVMLSLTLHITTKYWGFHSVIYKFNI